MFLKDVCCKGIKKCKLSVSLELIMYKEKNKTGHTKEELTMLTEKNKTGHIKCSFILFIVMEILISTHRFKTCSLERTNLFVSGKDNI